ncbi:MAG: TIGR00341 family protein [Silvibacterium sp.]
MPSSFREQIERGLKIDSGSKAVVYSQIYESAEIASLSYWLEVILSSGIATLGLVQNSPAVIIGAMLISPLMGPIMSTGLALAVGDLYLGLKSVLNLILSVLVSILLAGFLVWLLPFHTATPQILSRIHPNLLDLGIAILSGLAGSIVVCRGGTDDGIMALPGVAIAVALMPPLCVVGFGLGSSFNREIMYGASLLFLTNLVAIVSSAFGVFLIVRMDAPSLRAKFGESLQSHGEKEVLYRLLQQSSLRGVFGTISGLRWRALMLICLLAILFVPLRTALVQVRNEAVARTAVQEAIRHLVSSQSVVAQQVDYSAAGVSISLWSTRQVSPEQIKSARELIEKRTGENARIEVQEVASRSELSDLLQRMSAPVAPPVPKPLALTQIGSDVLARLKPALDEIWPPETPLLSYELGFASDGPVVHLRYQARTALDSISSAMLQRSLQSRLALPTLQLDLERVPLARPSARGRKSK